MTFMKRAEKTLAFFRFLKYSYYNIFGDSIFSKILKD